MRAQLFAQSHGLELKLMIGSDPTQKVHSVVIYFLFWYLKHWHVITVGRTQHGVGQLIAQDRYFHQTCFVRNGPVFVSL